MIDKKFLTIVNFGLTIDSFSFIILLIIFITLITNVHERKKKLSNSLISCIVCEMVLVATDVLLLLFSKNKIHKGLFTLSCYLNSSLICIFATLMVSFIVAFLSGKPHVKKSYLRIIYSGYGICGVIPLIPGINKQLITVTDNVEGKAGPLYAYFIIILAMLSLACIVIMMIKIKQIGVRDTIMFSLMFILPFFPLRRSHLRSSFALLTIAICTLIIYIVTYQGRLRYFYKQEQELAKKEAELSNLRTKIVLSQIQPHFLYNTLSSISRLCTKDPQKAQEVTTEFATYLRGNLGAVNSEHPVPFNDELKHIKTYLNIEKIRFGDFLNVEFDIKCTDFFVPALSLQPLVENAVKHGVCKNEDGGTVRISTSETDDNQIILIEDDGVGFDISKIDFNSGKHVGIKNVIERLSVSCNGKVNIDSTPGKGTSVCVYIPKES